MTPLQRAARAVREGIAYPHGDGTFLVEGGFRGDDFFTEVARAVLTAIREPSDGMRSAGAEETTSFAQPGIVVVGAGSGESEIGAEKIYQAMIDAMLEEE